MFHAIAYIKKLQDRGYKVVKETDTQAWLMHDEREDAFLVNTAWGGVDFIKKESLVAKLQNEKCSPTHL
jgi:putative SOS response-associated peptidase YedK